MTCLVLRLAGPMQSWGTQSRFTERDTGLEPSKSGVIGLLCAAMQIDREDDKALEAFVRLAMGVRVDRPGVFGMDYHTAGGGMLNGRRYGVVKASGAPGDTVVSRRYYLADAEFHVALAGDPALLNKAAERLHRPEWPLYLGRKSFTLSPPMCRGIVEGTVREVLCSIPWRKRREKEDVPAALRLALECGPGEGATRMDVPLSFANGRRRFTVRYVATSKCAGFPVQKPDEEWLPCTCRV